MKSILLFLTLALSLSSCTSPPKTTYTERKYRIYRQPVVTYREFRVDQNPGGEFPRPDPIPRW